MKKNHFFLSALIATFIFVSCNKEQKVEEQKKPESEISILSDEIYLGNIIDKEASPTNGLPSFYKEFATQFNVPDSALNKIEKQARIFLSFVVEKDGSFSDVKTTRDPGYGLGKEAIRILNNMPKWNPALINNQPVRSQFNLPITINLE